ncbi:MAG: SIR2 family protein [Planctomycetota bacterium]
MDIDRFIGFRNRVHGVTHSRQEVNLEEFMSFLDIEHFLGLLGSDTWSTQGNPSQIAIRHLIACVLKQREKDMDRTSLALYDAFVDRLQPSDLVVSFNYDTILETALDRRNKPFRLVPEGDEPSLLDEAHPIRDRDVILLKMHGSIDWFDIAPFLDACQPSHWDEPYRLPRHAVFTDYKRFRPRRIAGKFYNQSPLSGIHRVENLEFWFEHPHRGVYTPLILSPSFSKVLYLNPLRQLWHGFDYIGYNCDRFCVIGFALPQHDEYLRQPLANAIVAFQSSDDTEPSARRSKLKMVDFRESDKDVAQYKESYSFVDWEKTECFFGGFSECSLAFIFDDNPPR